MYKNRTEEILNFYNTLDFSEKKILKYYIDRENNKYIAKNKIFISNESKFKLKTIIGDYDIVLLDYEEYLINENSEMDGIYPPSRNLLLDFYVIGAYIKPKYDYGNKIAKGDLFDFDTYLSYSNDNFKYHLNICFSNNNEKYYHYFDIETILSKYN